MRPSFALADWRVNRAPTRVPRQLLACPPPPATQLSARDAVQVKVSASPTVSDEALATRFTLGGRDCSGTVATGRIVICTLASRDCPHFSMKYTSPGIIRLTSTLPDGARLPNQPSS